jgi:hypothetical protein
MLLMPLLQGGAAQKKHHPFAGKTSQSHLTSGSYDYAPKAPCGQDGNPLPPKSFLHAGKASQARISYDAGSLTVQVRAFFV